MSCNRMNVPNPQSNVQQQLANVSSTDSLSAHGTSCLTMPSRHLQGHWSPPPASSRNRCGLRPRRHTLPRTVHTSILVAAPRRVTRHASSPRRLIGFHGQEQFSFGQSMPSSSRLGMTARFVVTKRHVPG